jgi:hypothetical protein
VEARSRLKLVLSEGVRGVLSEFCGGGVVPAATAGEEGKLAPRKSGGLEDNKRGDDGETEARSMRMPVLAVGSSCSGSVSFMCRRTGPGPLRRRLRSGGTSGLSSESDSTVGGSQRLRSERREVRRELLPIMVLYFDITRHGCWCTSLG